MNGHRLIFALVVSLATTTTIVLGVSSPAHAADPSIAAEDLFQRGKALMTAGKYAEACPLLAESYRLDAAGGTLQNLAVCYESNGKWASAYARFQELKILSKNATPPRVDRVKLADEHIEVVLPRVSRIVVVLANEPVGAGRVEVQIDGLTYQRASWSAGVAVDPGAHAIVVTAPGKVPFKTTINTPSEAAVGVTQRIQVPALADLPGPPPVTDERQIAAERERAESEKRIRTAGFIIGGVGIAAIATGAVFGALTVVKNKDADDRCKGTPDTQASAGVGEFDASGQCFSDSRARTEANEKKDTAKTFANVANVLVPLGVVGLGIGAYLVFFRTSPSTSTNNANATATATAIRIAPSIGGVLIDGRF